MAKSYSLPHHSSVRLLKTTQFSKHRRQLGSFSIPHLDFDDTDTDDNNNNTIAADTSKNPLLTTSMLENSHNHTNTDCDEEMSSLMSMAVESSAPAPSTSSSSYSSTSSICQSLFKPIPIPPKQQQQQQYASITTTTTTAAGIYHHQRQSSLHSINSPHSPYPQIQASINPFTPTNALNATATGSSHFASTSAANAASMVRMAAANASALKARAVSVVTFSTTNENQSDEATSMSVSSVNGAEIDVPKNTRLPIRQCLVSR